MDTSWCNLTRAYFSYGYAPFQLFLHTRPLAMAHRVTLPDDDSLDCNLNDSWFDPHNDIHKMAIGPHTVPSRTARRSKHCAVQVDRPKTGRLAKPATNTRPQSQVQPRRAAATTFKGSAKPHVSAETPINAEDAHCIVAVGTPIIVKYPVLQTKFPKAMPSPIVPTIGRADYVVIRKHCVDLVNNWAENTPCGCVGSWPIRLDEQIEGYEGITYGQFFVLNLLYHFDEHVRTRNNMYTRRAKL